MPDWNESELKALYARRNEPPACLPQRDRIAPLPTEPRSEAAIPIGEEALRRGEVAVLVVAGGQGTRLGFDKPKGLYPVGPVSKASLFQLHALQVLALRRRFAASIPFFVMTSPATHEDTVSFFESHSYFGLPASEVIFFQQGTMPALDLATGDVLLEAPGRPVLSPNGHGGTLTALADQGHLTWMQRRGIQHLFYFQVDNPLIRIADPAFLGRHIETKSDASSKVVVKENPNEKVGLLALLEGRCGIIEYSDLPTDLAEARTATGVLSYRAGNPAIHLFSRRFLEKVTAGDSRLKYHVARKKVTYFDAKSGTTVAPATENALKFEFFIFDALPHAERWLAVEVKREDEFAPLKNATGTDSATTVRTMLIERAAKWLEAAGVVVPRDATGQSIHPIEINPLFAVSEAELKSKLPLGFQITKPTYIV